MFNDFFYFTKHYLSDLSYGFLIIVCIYFLFKYYKYSHKQSVKTKQKELKSPHYLLVFAHENDKNWKFAFDCDINGNVDVKNLNSQAKINYQTCLDSNLKKEILTFHTVYEAQT